MKDPEIYNEISQIIKCGRKAVLVTIVKTQGSTPRKAGAKMLVREDGSFIGTIGGGCIEAEVYSKAKEHFNKCRPAVYSFALNEPDAFDLGLRCGGVIEVYMERILPKNILYLIGAGHISFHLANIAAILGFEVHVIDDHPKFASQERFPNSIIHLGNFAEEASKIPDGINIGILIATRGHSEDASSLRALVNKKSGYFGIITSKKRMLELAQLYVNSGGNINDIDNWSAPAGLDIGAESPEEIAVAVAAEILYKFKGGAVIPLSEQFRRSEAGLKIKDLIQAK